MTQCTSVQNKLGSFARATARSGRMLTLTAGLVGIGTIAVASEEPATKLALNQQLNAIAKEKSLPAMGAVRINKDGSVDFGYTGTRHSKSESNITLSNAWHIGSITKSMTSVLAIMMVEKELVSLTITPEQVWPNANVHPSLKGITLQELLSHSAGITDDAASTTNWRARFKDERPLKVQRSEWAASILAIKAKTQRGEFLYSNTGYVLAGAMLETIANTPYEALLKEYLFTPLGMEKVGFGPPAGDDAIWGHKTLVMVSWPQEPGPAADNPLALGPAGTVHLSLEDMAKYMKLHLGHYPELLNKDQLKQLHAAVNNEGYALGWKTLQRPWAPGNIITHSGSNTMWMANLWLAPESGEGFFAVTNMGSQKAFMATDQVIGVLIGGRK